MRIIRAKDYEHMSRQAANIISAQVILKPNSVLGLATGSSPLGCYQQLTWRDEETLEKTREVYRAHLRFAKWMGAWAVGTETPAKGLTFSDGLPEESEEAYQLFLRGLRPLLRCAEEEGVPLAVEPVFCDVISTVFVSRFLTGWLQPWWPKWSRPVFAPQASPKI